MMNDYIWVQLYAQREAQLRAEARRRGGGSAPAPRFRLGWPRRPVAGRAVEPAATVTTPSVTQSWSVPRAADSRPASVLEPVDPPAATVPEGKAA